MSFVARDARSVNLNVVGASAGDRCSGWLVARIMSLMVPEGLVAIVRAANDAWNRGDLEVMFASLDPEFEWHTGGGWPGLDPVYRGRDGWRKFDRDFRGTWESLQVLIDEIHQVGDMVVALATFHARGREGIELRRPIAWVTAFRDGVAIRSDVYDDWDRALNAVGLRQEAVPAVPDGEPTAPPSDGQK